MNIAAAGRKMRAPFASIDRYVARSCGSAHFAANLTDFNVAGAGAQLHRTLHALNPLIARTGVAGDARSSGNGELVVHRNVALQLGILNTSDVNDIAVLLDRRVLLYALDLFIRRQSSAAKPTGELAGAHNAVHLNLVAGTGLDVDVARASCDIK